MTFLTVEDVNGVLYNNQNFSWHEIDTWEISETKDFTDVKYDGFEVTRITYPNEGYTFFVKPKNSFFANAGYVLSKNGGAITTIPRLINGILKIDVSLAYPSLRIFLYMGLMPVGTDFEGFVERLKTQTLNLNLKQLNTPQSIILINNWSGSEFTPSKTLVQGFNLIEHGIAKCGYLLVNLLKTDFQFNCTQQLTVGKVNKVALGTLTDYKPNGDMIGSNMPNITILYNSMYIPARFDTSLNDYVFDIDLTNKQMEGKLRLKVFVESNDVLNATETDIVLNASFETINNESKLKTLFKNGGLGRLGANITVTSDITVDNDVLIIGNAKTINMNNHKIIVPADKTFKAENTVFDNGQNTIQQQINSIVELNDCSFTNCTGFGSVIDCQINTSSLSVEDDFITNITGCTFNNNDMCILHGGDLNVTGCTVNGKIGNANNPYFLYQTDGEAVILQSAFKLQSNAQIESDIEFNSCIFVCGETAIVNGYSHEELQQNNISSFITSPQNNTSKINVSYYYPAVEDYITLESSNGYCHACSGIDFVFKNNVTARRE